MGGVALGRGTSEHVGSRPWLPLPIFGETLTMIEISNEYMFLAVDGRVIASAPFSHHAAADGNGAWIVSTHPARLCTRN